VNFPITGDPEADRLLVEDPLALLIGMLLDQQVPMEWAFRGPLSLRERLGGLDARAIAGMTDDEIEAVFRAKPALHRYPGSMAKRTRALCVHLVDEYDGNAAAIWEGVDDPAEVAKRLKALPGYGEDKAGIMLAILGKRLGRAPVGWEKYAGRFGDDEPRSAADVDSREALERVRAFKKDQKQAARAKQEAEAAQAADA
jgi:uncharacterized HhH-GPD family protein